MERRILIGSIIAVIILVLVSFTGVVGYRDVESDVKVSPLFNIRSTRAIDRESKDLTRDYIGKDKKNEISLPKRYSNGKLIAEIFNRISKLDKEIINEYKDFNLNRVEMNKRILTRYFTEEESFLYELKAILEFKPDKFGYTIDPDYGIILCLIQLPFAIIFFILGLFVLYFIHSVVPNPRCTMDYDCTYVC